MKLPALLLLAISLSAAPAGAQQSDDRARAAARLWPRTACRRCKTETPRRPSTSSSALIRSCVSRPWAFWSARALAKSGRLVNASERYSEVAHWSGTSGDMRAQEQAKANAVKERDELTPRIPTVVIGIDGATASDIAVQLDGEAVLPALIGTPLQTDPKHHVVRGTRGADVVEQPFDVAEGQNAATVSLKFGPPTAVVATTAPPTGTPPSTTAHPLADTGAGRHPFLNTQRTVGIVLAGAGVASGVVSIVFTSIAVSKKNDAGQWCRNGSCTDQQGVDKLSSARSAGDVATVTGLAGLVLIGAGAAVFFLHGARSGDHQVAIAPGITSRVAASSSRQGELLMARVRFVRGWVIASSVGAALCGLRMQRDLRDRCRTSPSLRTPGSGGRRPPRRAGRPDRRRPAAMMLASVAAIGDAGGAGWQRRHQCRDRRSFTGRRRQRRRWRRKAGTDLDHDCVAVLAELRHDGRRRVLSNHHEWWQSALRGFL